MKCTICNKESDKLVIGFLNGFLPINAQNHNLKPLLYTFVNPVWQIYT